MPTPSLPRSLADLLAAFGPCFTQPTFRTFQAVVVGVICHLPFLSRAVCLPILARLWLPGDPDRTPLLLARGLLDLVTGHLGDRPVHLVGDAAYVGKPLQALPAHVTVTARLRCD